YAEQLAATAFDLYRHMPYGDVGIAALAMREAKLTLNRRVPDEARLKWAREVVAGLKGRKPQTQPEIYAREAIFLHDEPRRELKLQAIRIGRTCIAAIPNEVFAL